MQALQNAKEHFAHHVEMGKTLAAARGHVKTHRKGQLTIGDIAPVGMAIIVLVVLLGIGSYVLSQINTQVNDSNTTSIINTGNEALQDLADWVPIIVVVVAAAIVIGLIVRSLGRSTTGGGGAV